MSGGDLSGGNRSGFDGSGRSGSLINIVRAAGRLIAFETNDYASALGIQPSTRLGVLPFNFVSIDIWIIFSAQF